MASAIDNLSVRILVLTCVSTLDRWFRLSSRKNLTDVLFQALLLRFANQANDRCKAKQSNLPCFINFLRASAISAKRVNGWHLAHPSGFILIGFLVGFLSPVFQTGFQTGFLVGFLVGFLSQVS